jgi:hypothetical protein
MMSYDKQKEIVTELKKALLNTMKQQFPEYGITWMDGTLTNDPLEPSGFKIGFKATMQVNLLTKEKTPT